MKFAFVMLVSALIFGCGKRTPPAEITGQIEQALVTHTRTLAPYLDYGNPCASWTCSLFDLQTSTRTWNSPSTYATPPVTGSDYVVGEYINTLSTAACNQISSIQEVWFDYYISTGTQTGQILTTWAYPTDDLSAPYRDCTTSLGTNLHHVSLECTQPTNLETGLAWTKYDLGCANTGPAVVAWSFYRYPNPNLTGDKVEDVRIRVISNDFF